MRIVFMGSSDASATALRGILRLPLLNVVGVVTQPDRPAGRRQRFTPCPCKAYATRKGVGPIISPEKVNAPEVLDQIAQLRPDVIAVVAFGQFLGKRLLALPPYGCVNGHFSLLPQYRGAAPVQAAIAAGDPVSGVTIMQMAEGMDDGDMLLKAIEPIHSDDTAATLMDRLAILCAVTLAKALRLMQEGGLKREPQDHAAATYAPKIQKADGLIDWHASAVVIERRIRAYDPWPGAFTFLPERLNGKQGNKARLKVFQAEVWRDPVPHMQDYVPGQICEISPSGPIVVTGNMPLRLTGVQLDGSRRMDGKSFLNGHPMQPGDRFSAVAAMQPDPEMSGGVQ
ncbi:MAG TPA: methionyl-tRNA formyltransferase [Kiritimatiellia bacterium]|jgi:methionyl-tRNA formyltransferase|nr:methionyl-tRNA formyltransferase [Kiritimatiellia bacterium]HOR98040.1 methionyl-tRNA formyltransferase [Kiritimatiellia bacterium]HPC49345.1 methionyl-tRNA formyltransferase [Kiritimatiellia bacterium]HPK38099.1 methionyl-tRNA formyltransferase [Kiritimatiellia bacterium]HPW75111.1 methionyl-tRNA formyltransferase [Kiritimatiellia bacterium]